MANKALQKTHTALNSFHIALPHNGLVVHQALLPAVRARCGLLSAGVSALSVGDNKAIQEVLSTITQKTAAMRTVMAL